ncbi:hypothetical protein GK047_02305 [Paenibacillus sp. SYP-B3998]|uniref:Butirosin biosynthesis protein H N-terminal domain-containing protein n=1 Tax=Paenibacillus sp. SYP-B3998 TaxID=2678564 RepID=A0A6G3ZTD5_9BACL|nr:hypothetical protein [Paenibacillus sp. SYP-B3998]NEW04851.1 hypothetical protein [Paenibacillus sp. SYP-B3998]
MDAFQLPVMNPPIRGYLRWAYLLSITSRYEKTLPWYHSNFIQLSCTKYFLEDKIEYFFDFYRGIPNELNYNNPFLLTCSVNYDILSFLKQQDDIISFFVNQIRSGYYCVAFLDESRIPHSSTYKNEAVPSFPHHVLLYGYDANARTFQIAMFDQSFIYRMLELSFDDFFEAYQSMNNLIVSKERADHHSYFYKFDDSKHYEFDKTVVVSQIKDYLASETTCNRINYNAYDLAFGLEVYEYLKKFLWALKENNPSLASRPVLRTIHVLLEHKKLMVDRIKYMEEIGVMKRDEELLKGFEELTAKVEVIRNNLIRGIRRPGTDIIPKVVAEVDNIREKEEVLMTRLLQQLEAN